jgi:hypothetical protein
MYVLSGITEKEKNSFAITSDDIGYQTSISPRLILAAD